MGFPITNNQIKRHPTYEPSSVSVALSESWKPRENQVPIIQHILDEGTAKMITLQTGQGKTSCSLKAGELYGKRILVVVLGRYYDKWLTDVGSQYGLKPQELMAVRGRKDLKALLAYSEEPEYNPKVIITTIDTLIGYINEYAQTKFRKQPDYCVAPELIYEKLGIGYRIIDEVHQHFHKVFTLDLHTHITKAVNLSATLKSDDATVKRMYTVAFPSSIRKDGGKYIKVADCMALHYHFVDPAKIRHTGFAKGYSHVVFEESLVKQKKAWENYLQLIYEATLRHYVNQAEDGQKLLIFAAKVETCELIKEYLAARLPDRIIEKYTSEDDYSVFEEADIVISTIGSSGTAIDIPNLITVIMTTCINSTAANEQALGRLRDLRIPGFTPLFIYFCCDDIPKQKAYSKRKVEMFRDKVHNHKHVFYDKKL